MDLELAGKVVLITGGSKGIGLACARAFATEGARVAITSRSADNLRAAATQLAQSGITVDTQVADLIDAVQAVAAVRGAETALGPIDILINSAGAAIRTVPEELTPSAWAAAMDAKYFTYIHSGVRVNAINPGATLTGRVASSLAAESKLTGKSEDELRKANEDRIPLGRYARPEEIADAALFLASARASYVTGAMLTMDGGLTPLVV